MMEDKSKRMTQYESIKRITSAGIPIWEADATWLFNVIDYWREALIHCRDIANYSQDDVEVMCVNIDHEVTKALAIVERPSQELQNKDTCDVRPMASQVCKRGTRGCVAHH